MTSNLITKTTVKCQILAFRYFLRGSALSITYTHRDTSMNFHSNSLTKSKQDTHRITYSAISSQNVKTK